METEQRRRLNAFGDVICPSCGTNLIPPPGAVLVSRTGRCAICKSRFFVTTRCASRQRVRRRLPKQDVYGDHRPWQRGLNARRERIARMRRSADPLRRQCGWILARFAPLPRTEGAFYLKFRTLAPVEIEALGKLWQKVDPWRLVKRICRFFGV